MFPDTKVTITRDGTPIYTDIPVQIDQLSEMEASMLSLPPYYSYDVGVERLFPAPTGLNQNDYLIDQKNNDPTTGKPKMYQIVNEPKQYIHDGHTEFRAIRSDRAAITK